MTVLPARTMVMTEDGSQWIQLSREDFVDGIKRLKPGRMLKSFLLRELQIGFIDGEVIFAVEGASTSRPAKGQWDGFVCLAYGMLFPYLKVKPDSDPVRLTFDAGRLKIGTTSFNARWISASPVVSQMVLEAHFLGPVVEPVKLYCPRCGKREAHSQGALLDMITLSKDHETLLNLLEKHGATHGCTLCHYGWVETCLD